MAYDKVIDSVQLDADLKSIADAIRAKGETIEQLVFPTGFISAINALPTDGYSWGDQNAVGDINWWTDLSKYLKDFTDKGESHEKLKKYLGKTKKIVLTTPILGTTEHLVRCIGYDCDVDTNFSNSATLTFQTVNSLKEPIFADSAKWDLSRIRTKCYDYGNALPFQSVLGNIIKGIGYRGGGNWALDQPGFKAFLVSSAEMGYTYGNPRASEEWCMSGPRVPYQYYDTNDKKEKGYGDDDTSSHYWHTRTQYDDSYRTIINSGGDTSYISPSTEAGFAPAFCIVGK